MAFNEDLADRVREVLAELPRVEEKRMFGGVCFMVNDKMCIGIIKDDLMCRIGPEQEAAALEQHGCRPMDFTHRPMKGYVYVEASTLHSNKSLNYWINLCLDYNLHAPLSKKKQNEAKGKKRSAR